MRDGCWIAGLGGLLRWNENWAPFFPPPPVADPPPRVRLPGRFGLLPFLRAVNYTAPLILDRGVWGKPLALPTLP